MKRADLLVRLGYVAVIAFATVAEPTIAIRDAGVRLGDALNTSLSGRDVLDALRNVLLFSGWGAVWTITAPRGRAWPIVLKATASGLLLSAAVEAFQLLSPVRTPSALDLATNTAGAMAGALLAAVVIVILRAGRGHRSYVGLPMFLFAAGYGLAVTLEAVSPLLRQERIPGLFGGPLDRLGVALANLSFTFDGFSVVDVLLFVPAGSFAVAALSEFGAGYGRATAWVAGAGVAAMAACELVRGAAGFPIEPGALTAHALGVLIGAGIAMQWIPPATRALRGAARPLVLWWLYAFTLLLWYLRPFSPQTDLAAITASLSVDQLVPLRAYRDRLDVLTVADAAIPVVQLVPLGGLMAVWPFRRRGWLGGILPAVYVIATLESAQLLFAGRYFDVTDVIVAAAALGLGWAMTRRAGYNPYGEMLPVDPGIAARSGSRRG